MDRIRLSGKDNIYATQTNTKGAESAPSNVLNYWSVSTPALPVLTDHGSVAIGAGGTTKDGEPIISGKGLVGNTITVFDGAAILGTATVNQQGQWSFMPSANLTGGSHSITVTETNAYNTSAHSPIFTFTYTPLPTLPLVTGLDDAVGPVTGPITAGSTTDDARPALHGTGAAGETIKLYDGAKLIGSTTVGADGNWTVQPATALANGLHDLHVTATNAQGVSAYSTDISFTVDTTVPAPPVLSGLVGATGVLAGNVAPGGVSSDGKPTLSGTGHAGDTINVYDGAKLMGKTTVNADGGWSFTPATALSYGKHTLNVSETNAAGVTGATSPYPFTYTGIMFTGMTDSDGNSVQNGGTASSGTVTLTGWLDPAVYAASGAPLQVYLSGGNVSSLGSPVWLLNGVAATVAGNTFTVVLSKSVFFGVGDGFLDLSNGTYMIGVRAGSAMTMTIPGFDWTFTDQFAAPAAPAIPGVTETSGISITSGCTTASTDPHIAGRGTAGDTITVYDGKTILGTTTVGVDGSWAFTPPVAIDAGAHNISVTTSNATGTSAHSPALAFNCSSSVPLLTGLANASGAGVGNVAPGGITTDGQPVFTGKGHAGDTINVYDGQTLLGSTVIQADGNWAFKPATPLSFGAHSLNATETGSSGTTAHSGSYDFKYAGAVITGISDVNGNALENGGMTNGAITITGWVDPSLPNLAFYIGGGTVGDMTLVKTGPVIKVNGNTFTITMTDNVFVGWGGSTIGSGTYSLAVRAAVTDVFSELAWTITDTFGKAPFAPSAPSLTDNSGSLIPLGSTTSLAAPHISGKGAAGDTITVYDGSTLLGTALVGTNGKWTFTPSGNLANGAHDLNVTETNAGGTSAHSANAKITVSILSQSLHLAQDDTSSGSEHADAAHTVIGAHDTYTAHAGTGDHVVELSVDPTAYFRSGTAHIQGAHDGFVDTLFLSGSNEVLDLTSLSGHTSAAKLSGIEAFNLGGHANTLKLSLLDVLNLGEQDLFQHDGHQQLMVKGSNGDSVDLSNAHVAGVAEGQWQHEGTTEIGGVIYHVYEHSGAHSELLVQQGVNMALHN